MSKHTPGPWVAEDNSWEFSTVYGLDGEAVALCKISDDVTEETQDALEPIKEANARLIAAAPQLLSALNAMLTHMGMDEDEWNKPTFDQARAAIAKANGEGV